MQSNVSKLAPPRQRVLRAYHLVLGDQSADTEDTLVDDPEMSRLLHPETDLVALSAPKDQAAFSEFIRDKWPMALTVREQAYPAYDVDIL